jgi:Flp pilus assembly pilin Flp
MMALLQIGTVRRLLVEDDGQDLIEYALLTAAIGFAGVVGVNLIGLAINAVYGSWDTGVNSLWEPPDPA